MWSREDTVLFISQYREHEKLFRDVNYKKKSVWELITVSLTTENPTFAHDLSRLKENGKP